VQWFTNLCVLWSEDPEVKQSWNLIWQFCDSFVKWSVFRWDVEFSLFCSGWWVVVDFFRFFWLYFFYYCEHILRMPLVTLVVWCDVLWVVWSEVKWSAVRLDVESSLFCSGWGIFFRFFPSIVQTVAFFLHHCEHNIRIPPLTLVVEISLFEVKRC
jgi:hypothetical protein